MVKKAKTHNQVVGEDKRLLYVRTSTAVRHNNYMVPPWRITFDQVLQVTYAEDHIKTINVGGLLGGEIEQTTQIPIDPGLHADLREIVDRAENQEEHISTYQENLPPAASVVILVADRDYMSDAGRIVKLITWRSDLKTSAKPSTVTHKFHWSLDSKVWIWQFPSPPTHGHASGLVSTGPFLSNEALHQVEQLLSEPEPELLGQQLYREAWYLREESPRSALIIGIAAVEAGLKEYLSALAPDTMWLFENIPAPPIDRILRDFLPLMLDRYSVRPGIPSTTPDGF